MQPLHRLTSILPTLLPSTLLPSTLLPSTLFPSTHSPFLSLVSLGRQDGTAHQVCNNSMHSSALHSTALHSTALHSTFLHCTLLHCTLLYCTVCTLVLYFTALHSHYTADVSPYLPLYLSPHLCSPSHHSCRPCTLYYHIVLHTITLIYPTSMHVTSHCRVLEHYWTICIYTMQGMY
jgi:hypothetical protein